MKKVLLPATLLSMLPVHAPSAATPDATLTRDVTLTPVVVSAESTNDNGYPQFSTSSGTHTPIDKLDLPFSVQTVSQQVIDDQGAYRLEDALKNISSTQSVDSYVAYEGVLSRGFDASTYVNGHKVYFLTLPLSNAERVDIVKGAAAMQAGRIDPGGMVNVITRQPMTKQMMSIDQELGSNDFVRTTTDINVPLSDDKRWLFRLTGERLDENSFIDYVFKERSILSPTLAWATDKTRVTLAYEYRDEEVPATPGIPFKGDRPAKVDRDSYYGEPGLNEHFRVNTFSIDIEQALTDSLQLKTGHAVWKGDYEYAGIYQNTLDEDGHTLHRGFGLASDFDKRDTENTFAELTQSFKFHTVSQQLTVGVDHLKRDYRYNWYDAYDLPDTDLYHPVYGQFDHNEYIHADPTSFAMLKDISHGLYIQNFVTFSESWQLLAGGRNDKTSVSNGYTDTSLQDAEIAGELGKSEESVNSTQVGIVYHVNDTTSLYASHAKSFGTNNGINDEGIAFDPEIGVQQEVGYKKLLPGDTWFSVALFQLEKQNVLTADPNNPELSRAIGKQRSEGIELDAAGNMTERLRFMASAALLDTAVTEDNYDPSTEGNAFASVPDKSASGWLVYQINTPWEAGGGIFAANAREANIENTYSIPGYVRADLYAAYRFSLDGAKLKAQINLNNAFDKIYFSSAGWEGAHYGEPRTLIGSVRAQF